MKIYMARFLTTTNKKIMGVIASSSYDEAYLLAMNSVMYMEPGTEFEIVKFTEEVTK